jgi:RecA/RadA recombinase
MPPKKKKASKKPPKQKAATKGKAPAKLSKLQLVDALIERTNKKLKHARMSRGADYTLPWYTLRRPTGLLTLDVACSGGLPAGAPVQIIGKPGIGKSYLVNRIMAEVQKYYGDDFAAAVAMTEGRFAKDWAKQCGVRTALSAREIAELEYCEKEADPTWTGYDEKTLNWFTDQKGAGVAEIIGATAEDLYDAVLEAIASGYFQLVSIDSLGNLLTKNEDEGDMSDKSYGGAAGVNTQFMHKYGQLLCLLDEFGRANETTVIFVNQYRVNIKTRESRFQRGPQREGKVAGGYAIQHGKMVDIELSPGTMLYTAEADPLIGRRVQTGKKVEWEILKQKAGGHEGHVGYYKHIFGDKNEFECLGADVVDDMVSAGLRHGLIALSGAWFNLLSEDNKIVLRGQGRENFVQRLEEFPEFQEDIRERVFKANGIKCRYGPLPTD